MKDLEERVLEQTYLEKRMQKQITEAAMQKRYAAMLNEMKPVARVHARHILVKTRDEAVDILRDLAKGGDFAPAFRRQCGEAAGLHAFGHLEIL